MGPHEAGGYDPCFIRSVWVNGVRIIDPPMNESALAHRPAPPTPTPATAYRRGNRPLSDAAAPRDLEPDPRLHVPVAVWSVLSTIKPEHIAEMNYADCYDFQMPRGGRNAVYVTLKPGVAFEPGIGSYVVGHAQSTLAEAAVPPPAPAYRERILGVFDEDSTEPLAGVDVVDVATGTKAVTTASGTVSLVYLAAGAGQVRLHKRGYRDVTLAVTIAPDQLTPITATMVRDGTP
jgi:hypothetical protein